MEILVWEVWRRKNCMKMKKINDRVIEPMMAFEEDVLRQIGGYALQCGRNLEENLHNEWNMHYVNILILVEQAIISPYRYYHR